MRKRRKLSELEILFILLILVLFTNLIFKNKTTIENIFTKKSELNVPKEAGKKKPEIGDIVYYNHKAAYGVPESKLKTNLEKGNASTPGSGINEKQEFDAKNQKTSWRIWEIKEDADGKIEKVIIVSTTPILKAQYAGDGISSIWHEHNMHKLASILGYGYGAKKDASENFKYKVGSMLINAPDMLEGDKGDWHIGKNGIEPSAARALILKDVEDKLGINEQKIKDGYSGIIKYRDISRWQGWPYRKRVIIPREYVPQRDLEIEGEKQNWTGGDKTLAKFPNNEYIIEEQYYSWKEKDITEDNIPDVRYKEILFNKLENIDSDNWDNPEALTLATNRTWVVGKGKNINFSMPYINQTGIYSVSELGLYLDSTGWINGPYKSYLRALVTLQPDLEYHEVPDEDNAWDIQIPELKEKTIEIEIKNLENLDIEPKITLVQDGRKIDTKKENGKYVADATYEVGIKRYGTGDDAEFKEGPHGAKYNVEITGVPEGYEYKIIGKDEKEIDISENTSKDYEVVVYPKPIKHSVNIEYVGGENDAENFSITGDIVIKSGELEAGKKEDVTLKIGKNLVEVDDVDLFNKDTNTVGEITDIIFIKYNPDENSHTAEYNPDTKKMIVTYVPNNKNISISVEEDSKKYLANISEIKLKLVCGKEEIPVILKPDKNNKFDTNILVPERDKSGNLIEYTLEKDGALIGYLVKVNGYKISLKPILKLPHTGAELNPKNIVIICLVIHLINSSFKSRRKSNFEFKTYSIIK